MSMSYSETMEKLIQDTQTKNGQQLTALPPNVGSLKVLIACEFSGIVREAFKAKGWDAWSCDLLDTEIPGNHYKGDVRDIICDSWDMMIGFPPCTYLTNCGNRHFVNNPDRWKKRLESMIFVKELLDAPIPMIAIENPIGAISSWIRKPDQIVHPYYFGDPVPKSTCLWLKNLPKLKYKLNDDIFGSKTSIAPEYVIYNSKKTKSRKSRYSTFAKLGTGSGKERSVFFTGLAQAMATQWTEAANDSAHLRLKGE